MPTSPARMRGCGRSLFPLYFLFNLPGSIRRQPKRTDKKSCDLPVIERKKKPTGRGGYALHNCVFVGRDGSGQPKFACKRGTYDKDGVSYKRDVLGSDKNVAFPLPCDPAVPWVLVFEAPIDLMSFCTLHRKVRSNAVALCGLSSGTLDTYLRDNPNIRHVVLCLDADGPGREATEKLRTAYEGRGLKVSARVPPKGKDWNEFLQQRGPPREREQR